MLSLQKRLRSIALSILIFGAPVFVFSGCFGSFPLTGTVFKFNDKAGDSLTGKWEGVAESVLMWVFIILPVYGLAWLGDVIIFNLIEFWTGNKTEISMTTTTDDGRTIALQTSQENRDLLVLTEKKEDQILSKTLFTRDQSGWTTITSEQGNVLGYVYFTPQKTLQFYNADKVIMDELKPSDISKLLQLTRKNT